MFLEPGDAYFLTAEQYQMFYTEIGTARVLQRDHMGGDGM